MTKRLFEMFAWQRAVFIAAPLAALFLILGYGAPAQKARAGEMAAMAMGKPVPQMKEVLDSLAALGGKPIVKLNAEQARRQPSPADAVKALLKEKGMTTAPMSVAGVRDMNIPGPAGKIPIRVYTPAGSGPFPVLVYFHGGGWVIAGIDTYDSSPRALANAAGYVVVSVAYRQAPENKFPAAANDAYAATRWVMQNASKINGNPKIVAVGGESAGGNLAAVVSMMARDKHQASPIYQLLVYPITNHAFDTESYLENAHAKPLDKPTMMWFWKQYLRTDADANNPYASPLRARDFAGLPDATVIAAQIDPLRSEGQQYVERLRGAGIKVHYKTFEGVTHEFFGMGAVLSQAKTAVRLAATDLRDAARRQR